LSCILDRQIAGLEKRLGYRLPSELCPDFGRRSHSNSPGKNPIAEQVQHRICKCLRFVCNHDVRAVDNRQTFDADRSRDDGLFHSHRFEDFEPRPSAESERNHLHRPSFNVRTDVFDPPGHTNERVLAAQRLNTRQRVPADDRERDAG